LKPFHFKNFSILQDNLVFRVGTDAVLLGTLSSVNDFENILEIGSGTGIISLMIAQRNLNAKILAIDINEKATKLSDLNFS
jgi:tRNA1Val (adenine37-N6)-methyltransferase